LDDVSHKKDKKLLILISLKKTRRRKRVRITNEERTRKL